MMHISLKTSYVLSLTFFIILLLNSCGEQAFQEQEKNQISGLLTFTSSGITFLECSSGERFRILDMDQAISKAMGERPLRLDEPLYTTLEGNIKEHDGQLEFELRFKNRFEVKKVKLITEEVPSACDHHIKPILRFSDPVVPISVVFNYYVPAVVLSKPVFGRLLYFTFEDEDFPILESKENHLSFSAQGTEASLLIKEKNCILISNESEMRFSHTLELEFEGKQYSLCGGWELIH